MKKLFCFFVLGCFIALYSCSSPPAEEEKNQESVKTNLPDPASIKKTNLIAADAAALWAYITQTSDYTKWDYWPDHQGLQKGSAPHAPQHKVFVNAAALNDKKPPLDNGSIIVKKNIGNDNQLKALTVMLKVNGYNPDAGDWFWAKYSPTGEVAKSGKVGGCINCHSSVEDNDWIFLHEFE